MEKTKAVILSLWYGLLLMIKWVIGKIFYPIAYLAKDWVYGNDVIKNYTIPKGVQDSKLKWLLWLFLDDDQPRGYSLDYAVDLIGYKPATKWDKFRCAYSWSAIRNPMYNINYNYLSKPSKIAKFEKVFGDYPDNTKLRAEYGYNGMQLVFMVREDGRTTYLFSMAYTKIPFTMFYGWNADTNGRFTVAIKFK